MAVGKYIPSAKWSKGPIHPVQAAGKAQSMGDSLCVPASSKIANVPTEIWAKIFHACLHSVSDDNLRTASISLLRYSPLIIAHVCKYWRDIVFSDSNFWVTMHLRVSRTSKAHGTQVELLREWITRAKELSISLEIDEGTEANLNGQTTRAPPNRIYDFVKENSMRWHNLDISFRPVTDRHHILSLGDFPNLQSLTLRAAEIGRSRYHPPRIDITTPNLAQIRLIGRVQVSGISNQDSVPYARTRRAVFSEQNIMDFMKSFSRDRQDIDAAVEEIEYTNEYELPTHPAAYQHPPISLPHLTKFTGKFGAVQNCAWLLSHMECFSIQMLDITIYEGSPPLEEIGAFITRNGDQLQILKLTAVDVLEEDLLDFLSEHSNLKELHLTIKEARSHSFISNRTLEGLTPALIANVDNRCILPSLSRFSYTGHTKDLDLSCLLYLINSRSRGKEGQNSSAMVMDSFILISKDGFAGENPNVVESLKSLLNEGQMELHIEVSGRPIVSSRDIDPQI